MARLAFAVGLVGALSLIVGEGCNGSLAGGAVADASAEAATVVADAQSDALIACTNGYDCTSLSFSESSSESQSLISCCENKVCRLEPYDDCTDATAQVIQASSYDQSCKTDKDCVAVAEGDFCQPGAGNCTNAAISMGAHAQYQADVAKTRAASCVALGSCGAESGPCCVAGKCATGSQCFDPVLKCALGAACSQTELCAGGVAGCPSNCQCLGGQWQAPCPVDLPQTGGACKPEGAECGYVTSTNGCGAANCDCQGGAWSCGPTCILPADAGAGARIDAAMDAASE